MHGRSIASLRKQRGGKSGQHRAACFLTGRYQARKDRVTESATENYRLSNGVRVKTWGKSPRNVMVTLHWGKPQALKGQINRGVLPGRI